MNVFSHIYGIIFQQAQQQALIQKQLQQQAQLGQQVGHVQQSQQVQQAQGERQFIWSGILEWVEKQVKTPNPNQPKMSRQVACQVSISSKDAQGM